MKLWNRIALFCAGFLFCASVHAMGKGTTKIDFQATVGDSASSRLFIKRDVKSATGQLPEVGSKSVNDNMAGQTVTLYIGSAAFPGVADEKGRVRTPFDAKLTGNGKGLQVKANGLALESLFPLDTTDGKHSVTVQIKITCDTIDPTTLAVTKSVILSDASVTFDYDVKKGKIKGRGF
jgi:hypothetical protein